MSKKKTRFREDVFNLDLTYISDRVFRERNDMTRDGLVVRIGLISKLPKKCITSGVLKLG